MPSRQSEILVFQTVELPADGRQATDRRRSSVVRLWCSNTHHAYSSTLLDLLYRTLRNLHYLTKASIDIKNTTDTGMLYTCIRVMAFPQSEILTLRATKSPGDGRRPALTVDRQLTIGYRRSAIVVRSSLLVARYLLPFTRLLTC